MKFYTLGGVSFVYFFRQVTKRIDFTYIKLTCANFMHVNPIYISHARSDFLQPRCGSYNGLVHLNTAKTPVPTIWSGHEPSQLGLSRIGLQFGLSPRPMDHKFHGLFLNARKRASTIIENSLNIFQNDQHYHSAETFKINHFFGLNASHTLEIVGPKNLPSVV